MTTTEAEPGPPSDPVRPDDREVLRQQLGRVPRGLAGIGARCRCGKPLVAVTAPRLEDGTPFPTTYYLSHPAIVMACSRLEAAGLMAQMTAELGEDAELAAAYRRAHEAYLADRAALAASLGLGEVHEIDGFSAGGMPERVKCLHALVAHALAAGPGVNPIGDRALGLIREEWRPELCLCE
ncbi:DUF501 domain-containing protein [Sediminivirga luteola]|uniref:DUF501 domain-containing protein n=1 Tax=Sediminivirga luteola TaxID=1774748 RepID=A0A8J2TZ30_9MICO|nr:DUF501 domain-containing protein [Sediminivirga luteola]GGA19009.1 hypothetical protein GCM10011333_22700 [Sediminivirga luteola]